MRLALSNIALPGPVQAEYFPALAALGFRGLEVAPGKVWADTARISPGQALDFRRQAEDAGLCVVGLHSLFYERPDLGLFRGPAADEAALDFLVGLAETCAALGGSTLVFGSGPARRRGGRPVAQCDDLAAEFFARLAGRIGGLGVCLALEPLGPAETDYLHTLAHALDLVRRVDRPEIRAHADAKSLAESGEIGTPLVAEAAPLLAHCHASEPGLGVLRRPGPVDHAALGAALRAGGYRGWVSLEQRLFNPGDPLADIRASRAVLAEAYA